MYLIKTQYISSGLEFKKPSATNLIVISGNPYQGETRSIKL